MENRVPRDTLPAQREYHVTVTRPKHRVSRPPPTGSLTYIPAHLVRAPEFEPCVGDIVLCAPFGIEETHSTSETDTTSMTN
jgi:hypothetical protein